jgi:heat shock protein HslJ
MKALTFASVMAAILLLLLTACSGGPFSDPLNNTSWKLASINEAPPLANTSITVEFTEGKIGGSSGCNSYSGAYKASGNKIATDSIVMTLMACMDAGVMEQESAFLGILQDAQTFELTNGQLLIFSSDGKSLHFSQNP